jgi:hypothetical protein
VKTIGVDVLRQRVAITAWLSIPLVLPVSARAAARSGFTTRYMAGLCCYL